SKLLKDGKRTLRVERHATAEEEGRIEASQSEVGVGRRCLISALTVADRTRNGARALRSNLKESAFVDPGDAAAARPNRRDIDTGDGHGKTKPNLELGDVALGAVLNGADIRARPAHVERKDIVDPGNLRVGPGRNDATGQTGDQELNRLLVSTGNAQMP